jgi:regulator of cell morphogenesis and NO signaling
MTKLDACTPVGKWVAAEPQSASVFERLGIDYCCGGKEPLDQACARRNLAVREVLDELRFAESSDDEIDLAELSIGELVDHIVKTHHTFTRRELPRLAALARRVARVHGASHPELLELIDTFVDFQGGLEFHMLKEEKVLFPALAYLDAGRPMHGECLRNPIDIMEREHNEAGAALARMRSLTSGFSAPPDACESYRALLAGLAALEADLHRHVHKENEVLFPKALGLFTESASAT